MSYSRIIATAEQGELLETDQLECLERSFRAWAEQTGTKRRLSRLRILAIFLLIRYTGAKLNEVLSLRPSDDIDIAQRLVTYRGDGDGELRQVQLSEALAKELDALLGPGTELADAEPAGEKQRDAERPFQIDPAFVRRKFYERAEACGFKSSRGGPEMIRKARALELMRNNVPLPVVQRLMGHSTPNLTASHISFSEDDMAQVARWFVERESGRKTSARNSFFGKVAGIVKGDVQSIVELVTPEDDHIYTMVTNSSAERLGLKPGRLASAEIKAPWLSLEHADRPGRSSADNVCEGVLSGLIEGKVNVECEVSLHERMTLCAIVSAPGFAALGLKIGDPVRVLFSSYAVILHAD